MTAIITAYKDTGKFYEDARIELPNDIFMHQTERIAKEVSKAVPLLTGGFVHVRLTDEDAAKPGANFFNRLYYSDQLRKLL